MDLGGIHHPTNIQIRPIPAPTLPRSPPSSAAAANHLLFTTTPTLVALPPISIVAGTTQHFSQIRSSNFGRICVSQIHPNFKLCIWTNISIYLVTKRSNLLYIFFYVRPKFYDLFPLKTILKMIKKVSKFT